MGKINKYKILLSILILLFLWQVDSRGKEVSFPEPVGYVNDFAQLLSSGDIARLTGLITELEEKTTSEIAIVTLESIPGGDIESYAVDLFETWGIGKKGEDNGLLILVGVRDHLIRIEVGYGLEGTITDGVAGEVIRKKIAPSFQKGDFAGGLFSGTAALASLIAKGKGVQLDRLSSLPQQDYEIAHEGGVQSKRVLVSLLFLILIFFFLGGRFFLPWIFFTGGGFWGRGRGGFGGGLGGGFGGFGGGMSGGGGATGRW